MLQIGASLTKCNQECSVPARISHFPTDMLQRSTLLAEGRGCCRELMATSDVDASQIAAALRKGLASFVGEL